MPEIIGFHVIGGTTVMEAVCSVHICYTGRWLRWTSTVSSALKIRIGGGIVKTCQHLEGGVQQTTGSTTHLGAHVRALKQITFLLYHCFFFVWLGVFSCYVLKVCATKPRRLYRLGKGYGTEAFSLIPCIKKHLCLYCDLYLALSLEFNLCPG